MSITVTPTLSVAGQAIAGTLAGSPDLVAVEELRLTWGRGSAVEQPTPAGASLVVIDRSPGAVFARRTDLIGQRVLLGWAGSDGSRGTNFRGRVTGVTARPIDLAAGRVWRVALTAASAETELANWRVPAGQVFPAETFAARVGRIRGLFDPGTFTGGVLLPDRFDLGLAAPFIPADDPVTYPAAQQAAGGASALDLLRRLYASASPLPMVYNPATDALTFARRRRFVYTSAGLTVSAMLTPHPGRGGRYVAAGVGGLHLDAGLTAYDGDLTQPLDARITRVEVSYLDATAGYAQRTAVASTVDTPDEGAIGRRSLTVDTVQADYTHAQLLAYWWADVANTEARLPRLESLGYSTAREPFTDAAHAEALLTGYEAGHVLFLGGSWVTSLGQRPMVGLLGATTTYAGGQWTVDLTPGPVFLDPYPFRWAPLTIAAAGLPGVRLADVDRSVTFGDVGFLDVGAGFTADTALPYRGNPTT